MSLLNSCCLGPGKAAAKVFAGDSSSTGRQEGSGLQRATGATSRLRVASGPWEGFTLPLVLPSSLADGQQCLSGSDHWAPGPHRKPGSLLGVCLGAALLCFPKRN